MGAFDDLLNSGVDLMETLTGDAFTQNGTAYVGNFRAADPIEQVNAGQQFNLHGKRNQIAVILYVARSQFTEAPLLWEDQQLIRLTPTPTEYTILTVNAEDPNAYVFVLIGSK